MKRIQLWRGVSACIIFGWFPSWRASDTLCSLVQLCQLLHSHAWGRERKWLELCEQPVQDEINLLGQVNRFGMNFLGGEKTGRELLSGTSFMSYCMDTHKSLKATNVPISLSKPFLQQMLMLYMALCCRGEGTYLYLLSCSNSGRFLQLFPS